MSEREQLMQLIQMYDFALNELILYLDTHPNCKGGLEYFHRYNELRSAAYIEYGKKYGPVMPHQVTDKSHWTWIDEPWPWERSAG